MWLLRNDGQETVNYLFHTTQDVMQFITNPVYAKLRYTLQYVPVWQPPQPKPPSEREQAIIDRFPEPLSRG